MPDCPFTVQLIPMRRKIFYTFLAYVVIAIAIVPAISDARGATPYWEKFLVAFPFGVLFSLPILFVCGFLFFGIIAPVIHFVRGRSSHHSSPSELPSSLEQEKQEIGRED